jgi:hypothetical protein
MSQTTKVAIQYFRVGIYVVWVCGKCHSKWRVNEVITLLTDLGLRAGKRVDAACKEARKTGRADFEI